MVDISYSLLRKIVWDRQRRDEARLSNALIMARMRGATSQPGTPATDADPKNPNVK